MTWADTVASAAPTRPHLKMPTNSRSAAMLKQPGSTVKNSPSLGFSAVMQKMWKWNCSMYSQPPREMIRP